ncbi:hypothetical protein HAX54_010203 [Datura stramonium]|uniref:Uncharacterized protein n=1 Tax=Datura stramonium TaxID=4076 RepID=A0ABS8THB7_DATST|nr:hypothetical protein [Datura stramonium]
MRGRKERQLIRRNFADFGGLLEIMEACGGQKRREMGERNGFRRGLVHRSSGSFPAGLGIVAQQRHGVNERRRRREKREVFRVVTDAVNEIEEEGSEEGERDAGMRWSTRNNGGLFSGGFWPEVEGEEERGEASLR